MAQTSLLQESRKATLRVLRNDAVTKPIRGYRKGDELARVLSKDVEDIAAEMEMFESVDERRSESHDWFESNNSNTTFYDGATSAPLFHNEREVWSGTGV